MELAELLYKTWSKEAYDARLPSFPPVMTRLLFLLLTKLDLIRVSYHEGVKC